MILIDITFYLFETYIIGVTLYLLLLTIASYFHKKKCSRTKKTLDFVILIPAHNEELQIETTIQSVKDTKYSNTNYSIYVIADNCTDNTASIAETSGAKVFVRKDIENAGKGQALNWFLREHQNQYEDVDAIVIIDADTLMQENFLNEMSLCFVQPSVDVVQGFYGVSNPEKNWRTALSSAALNVFHHVRPAGRNTVGGTAGLKGNGMAFRTEVLKHYGWPAFSIVEDIEFSMHLLLDGILVHYNPDAIVYGEMASGGKQAETQRKRWEGGRFQIFKKYAITLIQKFASEGKPRYLDAFMELFTPPLSMVVSCQTIGIAIAYLFFQPQIKLLTLCLTSIVLYVISGQIQRKASAHIWLSIVAVPFFILWKFPIYFKLIKQRNIDKWERTKRESELDNIERFNRNQ